MHLTVFCRAKTEEKAVQLERKPGVEFMQDK